MHDGRYDIDQVIVVAMRTIPLLLWSIVLSGLFLISLIYSASISKAFAQTQFADNPLESQLIPHEGPLLYDREYPVIGYSTRLPEDPVARLQQRLGQGGLTIAYDETHGFLSGLLSILDIDIESQVLVFSRTSINVGLVRANNPRAIYFNDDTYIAWVPGGDALEIAAMDPNLGPVFYLLDQDQHTNGFVRHAGQCLRCHDSYTLTGGGVPRFIVGSGYTDFTGSLVSHEGWILTTQETPLKFRWGGWYVSGKHGNQVHLGNIVVRKPEELQDLEAMRKGNLKDIAGFINPENYLTNYSDIDALMVLEHQLQVQNLITRVNYDVRRKLFDLSSQKESIEAPISDSDLSQIHEIIDPLVLTMLMTNEAEINAPIIGNSGFRTKFEKRGPYDSKGRSLRELDLKTRLFRYPLSYQIYSRAFDALPDLARAYVYQRLDQILSGSDSSGSLTRLDESDRNAIREILSETKPEFLEMTAPI
jgi:hypothetical protein